MVSLSWAPEKELERVLAEARLTPLPERGTSDAEQPRKRLGTIREQGYVVTRGEVDAFVVGSRRRSAARTAP
ncbi:IclR family transcriptional regulator C-terminal domain-containing protein [Streptomyces sp. NBC_01433]|uniref:IclR family transcriptional regulator domain-containing protein n=1 Tax=Streptomyces sp. NBC_01433 TaxID=2903864 RepID=UPI00225B2000|nr:IclR family transcriptional regulator C-terminal domain-containing protein [Streptomyces sp. NBC_01433]MCX4679442.1 IclR family transcriptional regulator C-terminal domain-containing protein [Streptomyces sp. NBC_01433]